MKPQPGVAVVRDRWWARAVAFVIVLTVVRLFVIAGTGVSDTEAYYIGWARWPALSYYDHPPLVAWSSWLLSRFGESTFVVRLVPVACAAAFGLLVFRLGARLFSGRAAFFALVLVNCLPTVMFVSVLVNPEALLAPLWVASLSALWAM